jgi:hypothetical protein
MSHLPRKNSEIAPGHAFYLPASNMYRLPSSLPELNHERYLKVSPGMWHGNKRFEVLRAAQLCFFEQASWPEGFANVRSLLSPGILGW